MAATLTRGADGSGEQDDLTGGAPGLEIAVRVGGGGQGIAPAHAGSRSPAGGRCQAAPAQLLDLTYSRFADYGPHMRAALQLALAHQSLQAAGLLQEEPFRRGQRTEILATTQAPRERRLKPRAYRRLLQALAVVYGIER